MTKNKHALQGQLAQILASRLESKGYVSHFDGEVYAFTKERGDALWRLSYYLTGDSRFTAFVKLTLFYPRMEAIIRSLPLKDGFREEMGRFGIATSTLVDVYWDDAWRKNFSDSSELADYANALLLMIECAETTFAEANSNVMKPLHEATLFYTKWPKNMGPLMTSLLLIAGGFDSQNYELVRKGIERIKNKIGSAQTERWRSFMLAIAAAADLELANRMAA